MSVSGRSQLPQDDGTRKSRSLKVNDTHTTISYPLPNNLAAIFKVRFHVHRGNELVWQYPPDIDLQGVEYQMICSGLHLVEKDTIYFSRWNGVGVGVFENRQTDRDRGANMQAIGVLIALPVTNIQPGPLNLWQHVSFLKKQLARYLDDNDDSKEEYHQLEEYYHAHRYQPTTTQRHYYITSVPLNTRYFQPFESVPFALTYYVESSVFPLSSERLQQQQQWHIQDPSRSFSDMVALLGPSVFILWKAILLKKRILMMKPSPPMEQLCYFVYNAYLMDQWQAPTTPQIQSHMALKFNIGINDINELERHTESSYVACTSDTIFDFKKDLYDVLIKFPSSKSTSNDRKLPLSQVTTSSPITVTAADQVRYKLLMHLFPPDQREQQQQYSSTRPPQHPTTSSLTFYRYEWVTWWESSWAQLACKFSSGRGDQRTSRYPLYHDSNRNRSGHDESIHTLDDASATTATKAAAASSATLLVKPSQQPINEDQVPLLGEQVLLDDATLIDHTDVTAHASDYNNQPDQVLAWGNAPSVIPDTLNNTLLGFFHVLTLQLISTLQTLVENADGDDQAQVVLGIQDMVRLGLDPWDDQYLVEQLGWIYFNKRILVSPCDGLYAYCCGCCGGGGRDAPIQL